MAKFLFTMVPAKVAGASGARTCDQVFDQYIVHCEARVAKSDMAAATLTSYRKALDCIWRPRIGAITFLDILYSTLVKIADSNKGWSKKTYNNTISVLRISGNHGPGSSETGSRDNDLRSFAQTLSTDVAPTNGSIQISANCSDFCEALYTADAVTRKVATRLKIIINVTRLSKRGSLGLILAV
jgi:hypothetical protein